MAISTLKLEGSIKKSFKTEIKCSHDFIIDQPKPMGGQDLGPNPMEIFLAAIPGCICAIGRIISNQKRLGVRGITVKVEGDIDKDFLLGKTDEGRAGFTEIRVIGRCPIADNIANTSIVRAVVVERADVESI